jgi:phosphotransferase system  glucose/maltose/N-acetylglucosamine-specific IIC component
VHHKQIAATCPLIPYLILSSIAALLLQALPLWENAPHLKKIYMGAKLLQDALPILLLISIAFQLSKLKNIDSVYRLRV